MKLPYKNDIKVAMKLDYYPYEVSYSVYQVNIILKSQTNNIDILIK